MDNRKSILISLASLVVFSLISIHSVAAQSTVVNVPSTDVVPAKKVYLEFDYITNYAWERGDNSFQTYLPRAVVGTGGNIEAGVNVSYTRVPGGGEPIELQPNVKWQFYNNEKKGIAAAVGCIWFLPVTNRQGTGSFGQCYSIISKRLKGVYGSRFTGGAYALVNANPDQGTRVGIIAGYQQPLSEKVGFIVDWFSGENRFGYVSPGFYFTTPRNGSLSAGYAIANHGRGNNALFAYYGMTF